MDNNETTLFKRIFPDGVKTDHGGITLGDLIVLILDLVLLLYTGYRSWHFLSMSIPADFEIMAMIGLWGLDIGAVAWSLVWIFGSTTKYQDWASMTLFVIDLVGVILTSIVDTLSFGATMPPMLQTVAWYGIPVIIFANVLGGFIYHMTSPQTRRGRAMRKMQGEMDTQKDEGDLKLRRMSLELEQAKNYVKQRGEYLLAFQDISQQSVLLDAIEKRIRDLTSNDQAARTVAENMDESQNTLSMPWKRETHAGEPWPWATPVQRKELSALNASLLAHVENGNNEKALEVVGAMLGKLREYRKEKEAAHASTPVLDLQGLLKTLTTEGGFALDTDQVTPPAIERKINPTTPGE